MKVSTTIRALIVDDHVVVREGTELLLSDAPRIRVVGKAADGDEALGLLSEVDVDVMLLDLLMPGTETTEVIRRALEIRPQLKILLVSAAKEHPKVLDAIRAGGMGYLSKSSSPEDYVAAVESLNRGECLLPADLTRELVRSRPEDDTLAGLTEREQEILHLVAIGWDNHRIADQLGIAEVTARTHISRLLSKVGAANRVEAALFALRHGLATLDEAVAD